MSASAEALLQTEEVEVAYGRIEAVSGVSLSVTAGEIVAVLGANGAGKSSLLKSIYGLVAPRGGMVKFDGRPLPPRSTHTRVAAGLALVPEGRQILVSLSVEENLQLGTYSRRNMSGAEDDLEAIYARFPNLKQRRNMSASTLSGGEQQMLAIGRALMARPSLLMLDEP
ncbi:MAG: ATP-binding cassette domain-containing protein, partial [Gammaproteobacteria bacterium]|nr:ATP-binding cassette domain-containing protein [Gammaproteobacteria bacterium]